MEHSLLMLLACSALACSSSSSAPSTNNNDASSVADTSADASREAETAPVEKTLGPYESYAACGEFRMTHPFAGEEKDWAALRLSPPDKTKPFHVTEVLYWMASGAIPGGGGGVCHPELAHRVRLFTTKTDAPPSTPSSAREIEVPAIAAGSERREIDLVLETPFVVPAGEDLVIAVQAAGTWPDVSCLVSCGDAAVEDDRNYWGTGAEPPHTWKTLASFGVGAPGYLIVAYGHE